MGNDSLYLQRPLGDRKKRVPYQVLDIHNSSWPVGAESMTHFDHRSPMEGLLDDPEWKKEIYRGYEECEMKWSTKACVSSAPPRRTRIVKFQQSFRDFSVLLLGNLIRKLTWKQR